MGDEVKHVLEKVARYIEIVQPQLDKQNENRVLFLKRASQIAETLVAKGLMAKDAQNAFVDRIAADETGTAVWDVVQKLAEVIPLDELGRVSEKTASAQVKDPFERWVLYGDPRATGPSAGVME